MGIVSYKNYKKKKEEIQNLINKIKRKDKEINIKEYEFQILDSENSQLKKEKKNLKLENNIHINEINKLNKEKNNLINNYEKNKKELKLEINNYKNKNNIFQNQNNNLIKRINSEENIFNTEINKLNNKNKKLINNYKFIEDENNIIKKINNSLEKEVNNFKKNKEELIEKINNYKDENNKIKKINNSLEVEVNYFKKKKEELIEKINNYKIENDLQINKNKELNIQNTNYKQEINKLEKNLNNEKNHNLFLEKKLEEYEKQNKEIKEIYSLFENQIMNERLNNFLNNNCSSIQEMIEQNFNHYFKNVKYEMKNEINNIFNKENFYNFFEKKIEYLSSTIIKDYSNKTKHLNIYLIGKSGIGKSTLINKIIGKDEAPTGVGRPITQFTKSYESNNIRLWDTKGIEMSEYNLKKVIEETKTLIKKNAENNNPDEYIHCIWYCINGSRFEEIEEISIEELANVYDDSSLPIVLVYTHTISKTLFDNMKQFIKSNKKLEKIDVLSVLAEDEIAVDGQPIKSFGIKELLQKTIIKLRNAIDHVSFYAVKKKINEEIKDISQIKFCFDYIEQKLKSINNFNEAKEYLKNNINEFYIQFNLQEINKLNDTIIKIYIDKWSSICKYNVESYYYNLLKYLKDKIKQFYLSELKNYKNNYKNNIKIENEELDNNKHQILYFDNILNKVEKLLNEQINNFIINKIHIYIFQEYYQIINEIISNVVNEIIEKYKTKIIEKMQVEIENNESFKELFRNYY